MMSYSCVDQKKNVGNDQKAFFRRKGEWAKVQCLNKNHKPICHSLGNKLQHFIKSNGGECMLDTPATRFEHVIFFKVEHT